jgi:hypothetical protein
VGSIPTSCKLYPKIGRLIIIIIVLIKTASIGLKSPFTPAVGYQYYCGQILKLYLLRIKFLKNED